MSSFPAKIFARRSRSLSKDGSLTYHTFSDPTQLKQTLNKRKLSSDSNRRNVFKQCMTLGKMKVGSRSMHRPPPLYQRVVGIVITYLSRFLDFGLSQLRFKHPKFRIEGATVATQRVMLAPLCIYRPQYNWRLCNLIPQLTCPV